MQFGGVLMDSQIKTGFFVCSHTGDDVLGEGSVEKPFKSIYKVKDVIREQISMGMDSDIMIYLRAGEFFINDPLVFDENDSGREGYKIYYKNFNEEKVVLTGGSSITSWKKYNKDIYVAKVEENRDFNMLYEAGKRATMARYPKMLEGKYPKEKFNLVKKTIHENKFRSLGFEEGDIPYIKNIENLQIYLWPGEEEGFCWHQNTMKVIELDYKDNTIIWNEDTGFGMGRNCRYFIQGALELLNEPGEFYLDRKNSFLYYWPFDEQNLKNGSIVIPKVDSILMVKGSSRETNASNLVFDGLTIRYSNIMDWHTYLTHGYGLVYLENANNISIVNCDINNSGWHGIQLFKYVHDNLIKGNYIHNIGHTGIQLEDLPRGGLGPYINKATTVVDNYITTVGELVGHASCMELVDSGDNLVAHNKMEYSPRYSIGMSSMSPEQLIGKVGYDGRVVNKENVKEYQHTRNNVIEYNDMSKANLDTQDTGIIETWCPGLGNIFHNNALHDSEIHFSFGTGLYLDDIADNFKVTNNVIFNLQKEGKGILGCAICAKGIGNEISNNIIADNNIAQKGGAIGTTDMSRKRENYDLRLSRNIFFNTGSCAYVFSNWDEDRYSECDFNVFYQQGEICGVRGAEGIPDFIEMKEWRVLQNRKFDGYSIEKDPKFMDAVNFDYRLRYDSPAHEVGFNEIDFEAIGLSDDFKLGDNTDELDKIFVKSKISEFRSAINISTQNNKEYALMISGRTKKGYHLSSLEEYEITFQSDHENVVIVDNRGRLTATGEGVAKINITASKGRKSKSTFLFVIVDDVFDRIEYKLPNLNMVPQEKMLIKAIGRTKYGQYIKLDGLISFSSSDDNIIIKKGIFLLLIRAEVKLL